jgi:subtilisin-like proprotein convertase family protein
MTDKKAFCDLPCKKSNNTNSVALMKYTTKTKRLVSWAVGGLASCFVALSTMGQGLPFTQSTAITVNDNSKATPYPSTNLVQNTLGTIEKVTVTLNGVTHGYPDDLDIALVGPDGTKAMLMSDAGGQFDLSGTTITLDSTAGSDLPDEAQINSGTYKPSNFNGGDLDTFFGGPPTGSLPADLSIFNGKDANGTWNLYVADDTEVDSGTIRSWSVNLYMSPTLQVSNATVNVTEDTPLTMNVFINDSDTPLSGLTLSATSDNQSIIKDSGLTPGGDVNTTNRTITITPVANATGPVTLTVKVSDGVGPAVTKTVSVNVVAVNDAPAMVLSASTATTTQGGITAPIAIKVTDVDSDPQGVTLTATSTGVIPATNVLFFRATDAGTPGTNRTVQIAAGSATGNSTITIIATDAGGASSSTTINVTVTAVPSIVVANPAAISIPDNAASALYPSPITIPNPTGLGKVGKVVVSLINVEHANPSDIGVLLVSPSGQSVVLMRNVGDSTSVGLGDANDVRLTFDKDATSFVSASPLVTSTNRPADLGSGPFPGSAPQTGYSTDLNAFQGLTANGVWNLYVYDTSGNSSAGQIAGGWVLQVFSAPTIGPIANASTKEDTSITITFPVGDLDGSVTNITAIASGPDAANITISTNVTGSGTSGTGTIVIVPAANFNTSTPIPITVTAQDNTGSYTASTTFNLTVTPVNDTPTQSIIPKQISRAGESVSPVSFTIGDVENPGSLTVTATSDNPKLLPPGAIILGGTGTTRTITIFPAGTTGGIANITVTVTDPDGASSSQTFNLTVLEPANRLFENSSRIVINDSTSGGSIASPYPSTIPVSGLVGRVAEVRVTLFGITDPTPNEIEVLLVGPMGTNIVLMSDAGGNVGNDLTNVTLVFRQKLSDGSTAPALPENSQITSGSYRPTDYEAGAAFPFAGSPAENTTTLDNYIGTNPNGDWKLYIYDDHQGPKGGAIEGGWQLSIRTRPQMPDIGDQITQEDTTKRFTVQIGDIQPGVSNNVTASIQIPSGQQVIDNAGIKTSITDGILSVELTPIADAFGTNVIKLTIEDPDHFTTSDSFNFGVTPVDDAPRFGPLPDKSTPATTPISVTFTATDPEGTAVTISATSSDQRVVKDSNIGVSGGSGTYTLNILPEGIASGPTTITVTASDATGQKASKSFVLTVTQTLSFQNPGGRITINDFDRANPYPSTIDVSGVNGTVSGITVILVGLTHPFPDDVDVLLVSPDNSKSVMLMSDAGGGNGVSNARLTFATSASTAIPDETQITTGNYLPANYSGTQEGPSGQAEMPSPAPGAPYSTDLGAFAGVNPNGQWKLYVRDDTFGLAGSIEGGWILSLQTAPTISSVDTQITQEDTPKAVNFSVADQDTPASGLNVTVTKNEAAAPGLISGFSLATNGFNYVLTITPATNRPAGTTPETNTVSLQVTDGTSTASTSFLFVVNPVDDAPTITTSTNRVIIAEDGSTVINFLVKDIDSTIGTSSNIMVFSSNPALVGVANLSTNGPNNQAPGTEFNVAVTVTPIANQSGSTVISFVVSDRSQSVTNQVTVEVTPVNDLPTITFPTLGSSSPTTNVIAGGTINNIPVTVGDIETPTRNIVLTATSDDQTLIPNGNIIVGGSGSDRTITVTAAGTGTSETPGVTISTVATDESGGKTTNSFLVKITAIPGATFANNAAIQIPATGTIGNASTYPSQLSVSGLIGNISKITVTLDGLSHTAPDDIDILLVSPTGAKSILLSDVGGANPISNARLTFDQSGRGLGDDAPIISGTYQPTDFEVGSDTFPSPAPAGPYTSSLQNFVGTAPNGTWSLYIVDDTSVNAGQLASGWSIRIETAPTISLASGNLTGMTEDSTSTITYNINDQTTSATLLFNSLEFSNSNPGLVANISKSLSGNTVTSVVTPTANASGTNNLTITVRNSSGTPSSITLPMNVSPVNDLPEISRFLNQSTPADTAISVPVLVRDIDTPLSGVWVEVKSSNQAIVADTNIFVGPGTNFLKGLVANFDSVSWTNVITLKPSSTPGSTTISVDVYDTVVSTNAPAIPTSTFVLTVTAVNHQPQITSIISPQPIEAGKSSTNIDFTVSDADNDALTVTATSDNQALVRDADIVITSTVGTAPGPRQVKITTQPGVKGDALITLKVEDSGHLKNSTQFIVRVTPTRERILASTTPITIRDNNSADPYPSTLHVDGFSGTISKLTVTLNGFTHTYPDDVDVLLVSPDGSKSVVLMSDAGGGTAANGLVLKFDDTADNAVPDATALSSGTFKPFNYEGNGTDNFASRTPAGPAGPYGATLSGFNGISPNGDWKLYIVDDTAGDAGAITNGWSLGITTLPVLSGPASVTSPEDQPARVTFTIAEEAFGNPDAFTFSVSSTNTALVPSTNSNIVITGSGTSREVSVIPVANASGTTLITITEQTSGVTYQFLATFTPVNDVPTVTPVANQTMVVGSFITVTNFNYSDVETAKKDLTITFDSSDPLVVPLGNIFLVGNDIRIFSGTAVGSSVISIRVSDANGASTTTTFTVTVTPGQNPVFANTDGITIPIQGSASPYPSTIDVRGVSGSVTKVTVTLQGLTHAYPDDVDILLVGPNNKGVVLMSDAGAGGNPQTSLNNAWLTFDDGASQSLPDNSGIDPFGTYKPSNYDVSPGEFAAPAPAGPYSATFSAAFNGANPNGVWSLFVQDDAQPDGGHINGWTLGITTTAPTISGIPDQIIPEDTTRTVDFTVADGDTAASSLTVTADVFVDDRGRLLTASVSGSGTNRTITLTPTPNANGTTQVTVSVTDGTSTNSTSFNVVITPVNDAPVIVGLSNTNTPANIRLRLPFTVSDVETPTSGIALDISNSNSSVGTATLDTSSGSPAVVFSPVAQGNTTVTVTASDGTITTTNSFVVTVTAPAGPSISEIPSQTIDENTSLTVSFTITNSPSTNVSVTASFTNPNLVSKITLSGSGTERQALITLLPNRFGFSEIDITVTDDLGSATAAFGLTVRQVTPPVSLGPIADRTTQEDVPARVVLDVQNANGNFDGLTFTGSASNPNLVSGVSFTQEGTNMVATVNLVPHAFGLTTVTINLNDGTTTTSRTFALNVIEVDDAPIIAPIGDRTVNEDSQVTIQLNVTDSDSPLSSVEVSGTSSNTNIVSGVTMSRDGANLFATLNLVSNANGNATITIKADEGTNHVSQSFVVTVVPVNDVPTLGPISDQTSIVNSTVTLRLNVSDIDTDISQLTFTGATTNSDLVSSIRFSNDGTNVTATITLVPDATGTAPITITAHDGTNTVSQSFTLTVTRSLRPAHLTATRSGTDLNITVTGDAGANYVIEATTDFVTWNVLGEVTIDSDGSTDIQVPIFKPYQFFRARNE